MRNSVVVTIIRWSARALSLLSIGIILLFFFGEADFSEPVRIRPVEAIAIVFFPVGIVAGMVVGWWREGLGAAISVGSLLAFYTYHFAVWRRFPSGPFFLLFALPGFIFGMTWLLSQRRSEEAGG